MGPSEKIHDSVGATEQGVGTLVGNTRLVDDGTARRADARDRAERKAAVRTLRKKAKKATAKARKVEKKSGPKKKVAKLRKKAKKLTKKADRL